MDYAGQMLRAHENSTALGAYETIGWYLLRKLEYGDNIIPRRIGINRILLT